ncbi:Hypothetical protein A7982_09276 [Minicystis rosea]|nr:Hypothetical protein A7982_09276 [Minicystis rosea]
MSASTQGPCGELGHARTERNEREHDSTDQHGVMITIAHAQRVSAARPERSRITRGAVLCGLGDSA